MLITISKRPKFGAGQGCSNWCSRSFVMFSMAHHFYVFRCFPCYTGTVFLFDNRKIRSTFSIDYWRTALLSGIFWLTNKDGFISQGMMSGLLFNIAIPVLARTVRVTIAQYHHWYKCSCCKSYYEAEPYFHFRMLAAFYALNGRAVQSNQKHISYDN